MKYIVKNCPALRKMITISSAKRHETLFDSCSEGKHSLCEDRADCPIKQIIELVKDGNPFLTEKVLEILQVEEVNND